MFGWNTATIGVTMTVLLEVRNLTKVFSLGPGADLVAVRNASLTVDRGETLGLVGESGSGKTTLGRCILRLIEPTDGSVFLNGDKITGLKGKALRDLRSRMQLVFQDPFASLNPRLTVAQTLREPLILQGIDRSRRKARTAEILRQVGLDESMFDCYPLDLTASEQQRVGIARALVTRPELVVLDEPTSMLDPSARADLLALLQRIQRETGTAYVFISHDLTSVARISHRIAIMYLGHIIEQAPTELIMGRQHHPYSRALLSAVLFADPRRGDATPAHPRVVGACALAVAERDVRASVVRTRPVGARRRRLLVHPHLHRDRQEGRGIRLHRRRRQRVGGRAPGRRRAAVPPRPGAGACGNRQRGRRRGGAVPRDRRGHRAAPGRAGEVRCPRRTRVPTSARWRASPPTEAPAAARIVREKALPRARSGRREPSR